ncbi:hypothetical protein JCM19241_3660 [Vibrio ishigakensis]|uniref:Uncharacterized protein n=1 Tax=Vibrio ishigakensis TaxID=1481914 RepID=A0A0B8QKW6_9VIBR|nr:hypothetical protein JCM19241_3660 [Vibrio ishigakensis]
MNMTDRHAGIYVIAMFDTLIKLNTNTGGFEPHLAHQSIKKANPLLSNQTGCLFS